jgi:DNA-binding transcriptional MerR regulator
MKPRVGGQMREIYSVNQLAAELGVTPRAIRFYEAKGLLAAQRAGVTRVFDNADRARLLRVLRCKRLGFSLKQAREYLDLHDADPARPGQMARLREGVRARIAALEAQRRDLEAMLAELRELAARAEQALSGQGVTAG